MKNGINESKGRTWVAISVLGGILLVLFWQCLLPGYTLFANDGPLGWLSESSHKMPGMFSGTWEDLNSLGIRGGGSLNLSYCLFYLLGPLGFSKFDALFALLTLGLGAWFFFRQMSFAPIVCVLGGIAAMLNSGFFSAACWGVATHPITVGMSFFALGLLIDDTSSRRWLRVALAGVAVGLGVAEGADIGAIFSIYVAAFIVYQAWAGGGKAGPALLRAVARTAPVAVVAGFVAAQTIVLLVGTQIKGVVGTQQDEQTKQQHWDFATQWSLPKREVLGFAIPGLFGYRMDTPDGGEYWGAVGRDPNWDRYFAGGQQGPPPQGTMRFSGGGIYAGILVLLIASWAVFQGLRRQGSAFSLATRRWVWFWLGVFVVSLLLAFGRFAPFYQFLYALPYFSTIRNPAKFTYLCNWAIIVLFGFGLNGLHRLYFEPVNNKNSKGVERISGFWQRIRGLDRRWAIGCGIALAAAALGLLIFASSGDAFEKYLQEVQFDPAMAHSIAKFSVEQVGIFLVFFAAAAFLVVLILSGVFRGPRARWGGILVGLLLTLDLGRADQPWIITWNYQQKYATNPIIDFLRKQPYEHRVASLPRWLLQVFQVPQQLAREEQYFRQLYGIEWTQHHFLYYDIQSLDVVQMPRMPEDLADFQAKFFPTSSADLPRVTRQWELTNTRYLLGAAGFLTLLNHQFDPTLQRFRIAERFNIVPKPGITQPTKLEELTAVTDTNGPFALFEFAGALPRVSLYSNWQVKTNDQAALDELANLSFDPAKTVLISDEIAGPKPATGPTQTGGEVHFTSYAPKDIHLQATANSPSILLLNDRFDPVWQVFVDDKPEKLLRCDYIMRGVYLPPGSHKVEFKFVQPMGTFYISLAAVALGALLCTVLVLLPTPPKQEVQESSSKVLANAPVGSQS